ncbi:glyoxalase superfamily protein [Rhizobium sp. PL01]|uniref:glyoxalase superfamily protein n=1 Tax=Rhizobium sp. PL01 TaxID=3085631 RepID=UPI0029810AD6|nr:glyoxalase superfamily protein [Rhizobium sp. PL01]MDW5315222.1 glyoxalase superfamily protein [Rhizobium sp. PL01]
MRDFRDAKLMAKVLKQAFADRNTSLSHSEALEIVASQFGYDQWNILSAKIDTADRPAQTLEGHVGIEPPIPIFRIFDVAKAMEFYCGFLGFTLDWEHRFGDNFPLYCQVTRENMILHLSEHAGDASPGARVFVRVRDAAALQAELAAKDYRYMKPGVTKAPWGLEVGVIDPFNNRITFCQQQGESQDG